MSEPPIPPEHPFRFFDNRGKYLLFVTTTSEKQAIAARSGERARYQRRRPLWSGKGAVSNGLKESFDSTRVDPNASERFRPIGERKRCHYGSHCIEPDLAGFGSNQIELVDPVRGRNDVIPSQQSSVFPAEGGCFTYGGEVHVR